MPSEELDRAMHIFNQTIGDHILHSEEDLIKKGGQKCKPFTLLKLTLEKVHYKSQFLGWVFSSIYVKAHQSASPDGEAAQIMETMHELEEGEDFKQEFTAIAGHLNDSFFSLSKWPPSKRSHH